MWYDDEGWQRSKSAGVLTVGVFISSSGNSILLWYWISNTKKKNTNVTLTESFMVNPQICSVERWKVGVSSSSPWTVYSMLMWMSVWLSWLSSCFDRNFDIYLVRQPVNHHHKRDTHNVYMRTQIVCVLCTSFHNPWMDGDPQDNKRFIISKGRRKLLYIMTTGYLINGIVIRISNAKRDSIIPG